jgi:DNA-directed RNA polymerase specialized sigma24 family protein
MRTFFSHARKGEYSLPPGGDLWGLLKTIAQRKLIKHTRIHLAIRRTVFVELGDDNGTAADIADSQSNGPEEQIAILEELRVIIAPLCEEYQQMVKLRLAGYTIKEIAAQVPCCERTVFRALERFEELAAVRRKRLDAAE